VLDHSSGAIANALETLVKLGEAEVATEKPRRFRRTTQPADAHPADPALAPDDATRAARSRTARNWRVPGGDSRRRPGRQPAAPPPWSVSAPLLVDGCHRLYKAAVTGRVQMPAFVLAAAEILLIRSDALGPESARPPPGPRSRLRPRPGRP
jgi:hypothetical protein